MEGGDQVATRILVELGAEFLVAIVLMLALWRIFSRAGFSLSKNGLISMRAVEVVVHSI